MKTADRCKATQSSHEWLRLAVRYLARLDRTAAQVEAFLVRKGATPAQAALIVGRLKALKYLDDAAFAERWVEGRFARMPMGRERLRAELLAKGCSERITDDAIRMVYREASERKLALLVLKSRQRAGSTLSPSRIVRLLRQRGFDEDTIETIAGLMSHEEG